MTLIPATIGDITPEWLTDALREGGTLGAERVTRVDVKAAGLGRGFMGQNLRLSAEYSAPDAGPASFFAKLPTVLDFTALSQSTRAYGMEIRFYRELLAETPVRAPRLYWSGYDVEAGRYFLLLEDLGHLSERVQSQGCSASEAERVLRTAARFHAAWWRSERLASLRWLPKPEGAGFVWQTTFNNGWEAYRRLAGDRVPAEFAAVADLLGSRLAQLVVDIATPGPTLLHGDYRLDNLMFDDGDPSADIAVLDWQLVQAGGGLRDVAYFLGQSLTAEERGKQERGLVQSYHSALEEHGIVDYPFERCWDDYRRGLLVSIGNIALAAMVEDNSTAPADLSASQASDAATTRDAAVDLALMLGGRSIAAILETDAAELLSV